MVTYCSKHRSMLSLINRSIPRAVRVRVRVGGDDYYLHSCSRAMICRSRSPLSSPFSHPKSSSTSISMLSLLLLQCLYLEHGGHGGENDSAGTPMIPSRPSTRVKLQQACFVIDVTRNISFRMPLLVELISTPLRKNQLFFSHSLVILSHDRPLSESERDQTRPLSADGGACHFFLRFTDGTKTHGKEKVPNSFFPLRSSRTSNSLMFKTWTVEFSQSKSVEMD